MGIIALLYRASALRRQRKGGRFHPLVGERPGAVVQIAAKRARLEPESLGLIEQNLPDEYAVPEGDEDWLVLVELCGNVYQSQGHTGTHSWIEMLPQPYQSEMWRVLEALDVPQWMQEQNDYSE